MKRKLLLAALVIAGLAHQATCCDAAEPLTVDSDFEGASVRVIEIDQTLRTVSFMPGGDPERGWPCWWYFRVDGITPGETITLRLQGSIAAIGTQKPLAASWAMPSLATYSTDGKTWKHTINGERSGAWMMYSLTPETRSVYVAWGPPYTPTDAAEFVRDMSERSPHGLQLLRAMTVTRQSHRVCPLPPTTLPCMSAIRAVKAPAVGSDWRFQGLRYPPEQAPGSW